MWQTVVLSVTPGTVDGGAETTQSCKCLPSTSFWKAVDDLGERSSVLWAEVSHDGESPGPRAVTVLQHLTHLTVSVLPESVAGCRWCKNVDPLRHSSPEMGKQRPRVGTPKAALSPPILESPSGQGKDSEVSNTPVLPGINTEGSGNYTCCNCPEFSWLISPIFKHFFQQRYVTQPSLGLGDRSS